MNAIRAMLGILAFAATGSSRRRWKRQDEDAFRSDPRFQREAQAIVIALLKDQGQPDLAHIAAMRAGGKRVRVAIVSADGQVIEVLDVPTLP